MPVILYRAFDISTRLLYVGISSGVNIRLSAHGSGSQWAPYCHRVTGERYSDRPAARAAEKAAIKNERPIYNKAHTHTYGDGLSYWQRVAAYESRWAAGR